MYQHGHYGAALLAYAPVAFAVTVAGYSGLAIAGGGVAVGQARGDGTAVALGGFGFLVGTLTVCSHVAADALTPMGVTPLTPFSGRHYSLGVVRASNAVANWLLLVVGAGVAAGAYAVALSV